MSIPNNASTCILHVSTPSCTRCPSSPCPSSIQINLASRSKATQSVYIPTFIESPSSLSMITPTTHAIQCLLNKDNPTSGSSTSCSIPPIFTTSKSASTTANSCVGPLTPLYQLSSLHASNSIPPNSPTSPASPLPPPSPPPSHPHSIDYADRISSVPMLPIYHGPLVDPDTLTIYNYPKKSLISSPTLCSKKSNTTAPVAPQSSTARRLSLIGSSKRSLRAFASTVKRRLRLSRSRSQLTEASNSTDRRVCQQRLPRDHSHSATTAPTIDHSAKRGREIEDPSGDAIKRHATYHSDPAAFAKTAS